MFEDDLPRLHHMLDAAREALSFAKGQTRQSLEDNRMLVLSLLRSLEIIGETASRVSPACQTEHADIPWPQIVNMRNRLIHAYFDVDLDRVWDTITNDLPPLIASLERMVGK